MLIFRSNASLPSYKVAENKLKYSVFKFNPKIEKYINEEKNVMTNKFTFLGVIGNSSIDLNLIVVLKQNNKKREKKNPMNQNKLSALK